MDKKPLYLSEQEAAFLDQCVRMWEKSVSECYREECESVRLAVNALEREFYQEQAGEMTKEGPSLRARGEALLARIRSRLPEPVPEEQLLADIEVALTEVREERQQVRQECYQLAVEAVNGALGNPGIREPWRTFFNFCYWSVQAELAEDFEREWGCVLTGDIPAAECRRRQKEYWKVWRLHMGRLQWLVDFWEENAMQDDSERLQALIDQAAAGEEVEIPAGTYTLTRPLRLRAGVRVRGTAPVTIYREDEDAEPVAATLYPEGTPSIFLVNPAPCRMEGNIFRGCTVERGS